MQDIIALIPLAAACAGCIIMSATLDAPTPRRPRIGVFGMRQIFGTETK